MLVLEAKLKGRPEQFASIDEGIRTAQFIRNKALRYWMDNLGVNGYALNTYSAQLAKEFDFVVRLNSMARQASAERAWFAISRFFANCKAGAAKKGYPRFKKNTRSVEYKTSGWKLSPDCKRITFTDKLGIGTLKLFGTIDLSLYHKSLIKRVRLVKRADGYYCQLCIKHDRSEPLEPSGSVLGLDVGLNHFYTDSNGETVENPRFLRKAETKLKRLQRRVSKKKKGSNNRRKAINALGRQHLKVSRQRKDFAVKQARCVTQSNDVVVIEDLNVKGLARTRLAKSISDVSWSMFRQRLEYFATIFNRRVVAVSPNYTSQDCSKCENRVKKSLSTRTHICSCGCVLDRDHNAALNILAKGLSTVGHTGINASGLESLYPRLATDLGQVLRLKEESPAL